MLLTNMVRIILARQLKPFQFKKAPGFLPDFSVPNMGLYVHIPFCEVLCPFCPYYKIKYNSSYHKPYLEALLAEIALTASSTYQADNKRKITSLYFGGGSPALMLEDLSTIRKTIDKYYLIEGNVGIELHPNDVKEHTAEKLSEAGFDMVSIGIQSFNKTLLANLDRSPVDEDKIFRYFTNAKFKAIDVDLIFGIPGQTEEQLSEDFMRAVEIGATQISTYPFIDFSYAANSKKPQGRSSQKKLLEMLLKTADETGFARTSVWTFGKKDTPRYSSITRDCFLGFGPSATSLGRDAFKVNTFSVEAYIESIKQQTVPTALKMQFSDRTRKLYWLFWNCYNGVLDKGQFKKLFSSDMEKDFLFFLKLGVLAHLLKKTEYGWALDNAGSYHFHRVEQQYTHQYIDKTWKLSMKNPWPDKIDLY